MALRVKNISFSYEDGEEIIKDLSFQLEKNKFLSIVGSSGCGKSTLIKLIGGIDKNYKGEIETLKTAYMPQKDLLLPWRSVFENIILPLELGRQLNDETKEIALDYLKRFGLLEHKDKYPYELSGGMRQRVSFIRTLLTEADIFLLDEPFSALDAITKEGMQEWLLKALKEIKKTVIFITHDINEALYLSDKVYVCKDKPLSSFIEYEVTDEIKNNPQKLSEIKNEILKSIRGGE